MNVGIDVTGLFWIYKTGFENLYYALFQEMEKPDAWLNTIARVLGDDALRQDLIARGLTHAAKFTWRNWALGHVRVYTQLAHAGLSQETRD